MSGSQILIVASVLARPSALLLDDHPPGLQAEQRLVSVRLLAHQQLEGAVGGLELEALVLELLDPLDHPPRELIVSGDAGLAGLIDDRATPGELGDQHVAAVAHDRGVDVLEGLRVGADAGRMQPSLVRERVLAHIWLRGVGRAVEQLIDEVGRLGQPREALRLAAARRPSSAAGRR